MRNALAPFALAVTCSIALAGCSSTASGSSTDDDVLRVVASTNVYGSLAAQIGGDRVEVTSLIDSAAKDPHSYEASARDRLAVKRADLVIENGGGYDAFMQQLRADSDAAVITAVEFSHDHPDAEHGADEHGADKHGADEHEEEHEPGHDDEGSHDDEEGHAGHDHAHIEGFNEHVWFDPHTVIHIVEQVSTDLTRLDSEGESDFAANADALIAELEDIEADVEELHRTFEGAPVFMTEPLPGYLAAATGLEDITPSGFASAVEEGNDVSPTTLLKALDLIERDEVRVVLANAQTGGAETTRVEEAAKSAGIPVVTFSELLEADQSYAEWMRAAISDLVAALGE